MCVLTIRSSEVDLPVRVPTSLHFDRPENICRFRACADKFADSVAHERNCTADTREERRVMESPRQRRVVACLNDFMVPSQIKHGKHEKFKSSKIGKWPS